MTTESMQTEAATTTEGATASEQATQQAATVADSGSQQQQATEQVGAPEKYEFKAPEGREFSPEVIGKFEGVAKELNLTQAQAQKVLDDLAPAFAEREEANLAAAREAWVGAAKADKEFGGDKLNENLGLARKAMDAFGTPELRTLLDESGLGDHPEFVRAFYRVGKAISEDGFVGGQGGKSNQGDARRLYAASNMNP